MLANEGINPAILKRTAGFVWKKGGIVNGTTGRRNWKKRWFVIESKVFDTFVGYELRYFESPNGKLKVRITPPSSASYKIYFLSFLYLPFNIGRT